MGDKGILRVIKGNLMQYRPLFCGGLADLVVLPGKAERAKWVKLLFHKFFTF